MKEKIYHKLVRDKIPCIIQSNHKEPIYHIASEEETKELLFTKLIEELNEFKETPNKEELADLLEVIDALGEIYHINLNEVLKVKQSKKELRGGFSERVVLEQVIED